MLKSRSKIVFLVLLSLTNAAQGQLHNILKSIDEVEILGAPTLVSFHGVDYGISFGYDTKIKVGYSLGLGIGWNLNKSLSINLKFLFERKGRNISYQGSYFDEDTQEFKIGEAESSYDLNYLSAPITLKYILNKKKNIFIEGGPYISYLLKAQSTTDYLYDGTRTISSVKEDLAQIDAGITIAVGCAIPIKLDWAINLRLFTAYGLVDISHYPNNIMFQKAYTQSIGLSFGFVKKVNHH